jgi:predicted 2-oxoglutarate/Fe(II)-dependent dioxygenase YbiX
MCEQISALNAQGYVHLKDFLSKESCEELVTELKEAVLKGNLLEDPQCPKSSAIYGTPVFDSLLEQLLPNFERVFGKKLYPTYAFSRMYAPGEELHVHRDRPACQFSATITLGFDGDTWPIYMGDYTEAGKGREAVTQNKEVKFLTNETEIKMEVGDAVAYYGMQKPHWRNPYTEGKWQAQVFLHYVDADGPYADQKYDGRKKLSHHKEPEYTYMYFTDAMTPDSCQKFVQSIEAQVQGVEAEIGEGTNCAVNKEIRDVKRFLLPTYRGIGATMVGLGMSANHQAWRFDVTHSNQTDYLKYDVDGHYHAHVDTFIRPNAAECRKLTILMFLNDDFEGGRLFLQNGGKKIYPPQAPGTCLVFPSFILHGVEPVTKGIRRSVVTWLVGPWFK